MARLFLWRHEARSHLRDTSHVGQKRSQQGARFRVSEERGRGGVGNQRPGKGNIKFPSMRRKILKDGREMMRKAECGLNKEHSGAVHLPAAFLRLCWEALRSWMNHARVGHPQTSSTLPWPGLVPKKECLKAELPYTQGEEACSWGRHKNEGYYF